MAGRVVLAMSGGVDSSVAAHLLKERGYEVIGLFMRTGAHVEETARREKTCCSATDALDAQRVADRLDIPFYALDFERDFGRIMDNFVDEYLVGRTPNPCVLCNVWLKFGKLWAYGKQVGADFVATGHHARILPDEQGRPRVARAVDRGKDQSYVLFGLRRELLPHVLLPVGGYPKEEIRRLAKDLALPVHNKRDSQEICFIPDNDYLNFVQLRMPSETEDRSGPIVDEDGVELGRHEGIEGFTIGQRRGLGLAVGEPRYVVGIEPATRTVRVGRRSALEKPGLTASRFNWQVEPPTEAIRCRAQIRARHEAVEAVVRPIEADPAQVEVRFETPQTAVTPGQIVTIYQDDFVLGGGWIDGPIEPDERSAATLSGASGRVAD